MIVACVLRLEWRSVRQYLAYALSCIRREDLKLKPKQEEALDHLYNGRDVFAWIFPCTPFQFYVEFYD